ncbi:universal stress protein PHOS32-like [Nicotiana tabacum]|uniref:Universal stress protein A-like protein n=1 Tax=Nicotiana tabacum TaxID=4097 RepID=A0A1S4CSQ3_TOBAC|nr:universal stress protein PHOS32-like [Nicotiana tomentosiformis]XP_016504111.1 PREDICTED: universal stress protein A-like protein [Nicotiana tabacum]
MAEKQVMIFALDDSDHSFYALEWTLDHFFPSPSTSSFKLIIVHAKPNPTSVIGVVGPGTTDMYTMVETDIKKTAQKIIDRAKELSKSKGVANVACEILEGDARNVICDAVERHHASLLVMGSHGYGTFKRAVLGSVSDYCSHHAHCSVMIVKKPKPNN